MKNSLNSSTSIGPEREGFSIITPANSAIVEEEIFIVLLKFIQRQGQLEHQIPEVLLGESNQSYERF